MRTSLDSRPGRRHPAVIVVAAAVAVLTLATACSSSDETSGPGSTAVPDRPTIVATTSILGDVTANVVGDLATVEVLIPAGADPHDFEASARQAAQLRDADLVVAVGLGLEAGLTDTLEAAEQEGTPVLAIGPELSPIPFGGTTGGSGQDPHVWMDLDRMAAAALLIGDRIAVETELDADVLRAQAQAYDGKLQQADEEIQAALADIPDDRRKLVTNHDALGYFAARYGFEVVGTVIPGGGTEAEPSASSIVELAAVLEAEGVTAIFAENVDDTRLAETLAGEVGTPVAVVTLYTDALGEPGSGADTYVGLLVTDARRIAEALRG